ncbi:MAG: hypothetical protein Q9216_005761 [Gyalolechia sp. 2 TL-2023]
MEYSFRERDKDSSLWIFWIYGGNAARFEQGYQTIADRVKLPRRDDPGVDVVRLVNTWLSDEVNGRWLMILDNLDDLELLARPCERRPMTDTDDSIPKATPIPLLIPQTQNGSILITSRNRNAAFQLTGNHQDIINVEPMDESSALQLLRTRVKEEIVDGDAVRLVQALDYMPLAISQAGAFVSQRAPRITVSRYLNDFRKSKQYQASLLNRDAGDIRRDHSANNSIITTWQMSFENVRAQRPSAAWLLSMMSLFDRQGIPEWLLRCYYEDKPNGDGFPVKPKTEHVDGEDVEFEDDISILEDYFLVRTTTVDGILFEMHRLVQFSTQRWLASSGELEISQERYLRTMSGIFPSGEYETWTKCRALFPHAKVVLEYQPTNSQHLLHWTNVLSKAGYYASKMGYHSTAEAMCQRALEETEKALGEEHPDTLRIVNDLATALSEQGKYGAAEEMGWRAVKGQEKALGEEHPETLNSVTNLANVLSYQMKHEAAERMGRRALEGWEKALGPTHDDTLNSVHCLAMALYGQEKYEAAEMMCRRAFEGSEKSLGKEHQRTLTSVHNLALVLGKQGKLKAAEEMCQRVLEGSEKILGKEHPGTLLIVHSLACVFYDQARYHDADTFYQRALRGQEKALGKDHLDTLISVHNIALLYHNQKRYIDAEISYQRAIEGQEKTLGKDHPNTLASVYDLAYLFYEQERYSHAEVLFQRALDGREKMLGKNHQKTLRTVCGLAELYYEQKRYDCAKPLFQRACAGF